MKTYVLALSMLPWVLQATVAGAGRVRYAGVNIGGLDWGCTSDGNCKQFGQVDPRQEGLDQMNQRVSHRLRRKFAGYTHPTLFFSFVKDTGLNAFRILVAWQYPVDGVLGGKLDPERFGNYNRQVQGCINSGAQLCIIDVHNYARWNGGIIGQSGPSDAQFTSLSSQLATKYKSNPQVAFGLINEPHDLDIWRWATTCQAAVTAIRKAGASKSKIFLPGTDSTSAGSFLYDGSAEALSTVKNLDGSTANLIFKVHKYLDFDDSGTHNTCARNNVEVFQNLGNWLRQTKRKAFLAGTGGSAFGADCRRVLCKQLDVLNAYSDVYLGWAGWAPGTFEYNSMLAETPKKTIAGYQDVPLVKECIAGKFKG